MNTNDSNGSNNCSGNNLIALSSSLAILIGNEFDTDDLNVLGAFFTTLGDNLSLIAATR